MCICKKQRQRFPPLGSVNHPSPQLLGKALGLVMCGAKEQQCSLTECSPWLPKVQIKCPLHSAWKQRLLPKHQDQAVEGQVNLPTARS